MDNLTQAAASHLAQLPEAEIAHLLRGFPEPAISGALALRAGGGEEALQSCLLGILTFYLPSGISPPEELPSADTRLREDLGLDSLALAEAMFKIEELFAITVLNTEIATVDTLADTRRLLAEKLTSPQAPETHA